MLWQHDAAEPIREWTAICEDARSLYVEGRLARARCAGRGEGQGRDARLSWRETSLAESWSDVGMVWGRLLRAPNGEGKVLQFLDEEESVSIAGNSRAPYAGNLEQSGPRRS
ncbi:hypothetical protein HC237_08925 [Ochrobactrum intermedium]|nr:hypothetical protein F9K72_17115 [Brucella intermedia]NKE75533.1 hypothetical protein [Ochrobactrum sp. MC-1LL]